MEITFQEAEFIKQIFRQALAGLEHLESKGEQDFETVVAFLGSLQSDEDTKEAIETMRSQKTELLKMIDRINDEYGMNEVSFPGDGQFE